jgi:hypothetical protein
MRISEFKRVARLLKTAYAEIEKEALRTGLSIASPEYDAIIDRIRLEILDREGYDIEEYREAKDLYAVMPEDTRNVLSLVERTTDEVRGEMEELSQRHIPTHEEIVSIAKRVFEETPPQVFNHIVKEIKEPQIIKETVVEEHVEKYDDSHLKKEIDSIRKDREDKYEALRKEFEDYIAQSFKKNIDIMGMPDFRKLAMGLESRISELEAGGSSGGSGDVVGPSSAINNNVVFFDGVTGKLIKDSGLSLSGSNTGDVTVTDSSEIDFTLTGQEITASLKASSIDETKLDASVNASLDLADTAVQSLADLGITASASELNTLDGVTASTAELNFVDGVTSSIQTQLDGKLSSTPTTIELGHASDTTLSRSAAGILAVEGVVIPSISSTNTLTNKRITPRANTSASAATHTIDSDTTDIYTVTAQAEAVTFAAPNGTPTQGQKLLIRIKDNGTGRAITWNAIFRAIGVTLPTTTVASKTHYVLVVYNTTDTKWDALAVGAEA